jgi:hypothetical protein
MSNIDAKDLIANDVSFDVSGMANIEVYVNNFFKVDLSGMGSVYYYGNPKKIDQDVSGMARIKSMDSKKSHDL